MAFKLPFSREELRYLLENETIFKRIPQLSIDNFVKYLFPQKGVGMLNSAQVGASDSSDSNDEDLETQQNGSRMMNTGLNMRKTGTTGTGSLNSASPSRH